MEAPGALKVDGESIPRRTVAVNDGLKTVPGDGVETVYDILRHSASKYGDAKALGSRKLVRTHDEVKKVKKNVQGKESTVDKKWTYYEMSDYHYLTFREYERIALQCGAGLRKLGMNKDDRLHIFAATTPYWLAMAHGTVLDGNGRSMADIFQRGRNPIDAYSHCIRYSRGGRPSAFTLSNQR